MPASKAQRANTAERRKKAITLRLAGMDWQSIADQLGYSTRGAACTDVARALEANLAEQSQAADTLREVETLRLDRLQAAAWPSAVKGDLKAIETVLKVIDRRVKLQGLDMPLRAELSGPDGGAIPFSTGEAAEVMALIDISDRDNAEIPAIDPDADFDDEDEEPEEEPADEDDDDDSP